MMPSTTAPLPTIVPVGAAARRSRAFEALRYLCASIAALGLDVTVLWTCTAGLGFAVWWAGALAYASGLVLIYFLSVHWVFAARSVTRTGTEFLLFAGLGVIGLLVNSATLSIATSMGVALAAAKALSAAVGFVTNFLTRKAILFSTSQS